jgi:hypothetical protein
MEKPCIQCGKTYQHSYVQEMFCSIDCRFYNKVEKTKTCWNWIAGVDNLGYGQFTIKHRGYKAHRFTWVVHHGDIPKGMIVCHTCNNTKCVNIDHLYLMAKNTKHKGVCKVPTSNKVNPFKIKVQGRKEITNYPLKHKLTIRDIICIRSDPRDYRLIMRQYDISKIEYKKLLIGEYWRHI